MFNVNLKQAMEERAMSQKQLAEISGVSKAAISQYLSGKNEPHPQSLKKIADALDVDPAYFGQEPKPERTLPPPVKLKNITIDEAAERLGKSKQFVRVGLQTGRLPIGTAVKISGNKWTYSIPPRRLENYINGGI
jgi:DNA-binding Xre family transcriptional regulator